MKKVYQSVRSLLSAGAGALLTLLGFSSSCERINVGAAEYGTPMVEFSLKVKVLDQNTHPIPGLDLKVNDSQTQTDNQGQAVLKGSYVGFHRAHELNLQIKDIDGEANGVVDDQIRTIQISLEDFVDKGDGKWNNGSVQKEISIEVERK